MDEFSKLIEAAKRGDAEKVTELLRSHPEFISRKDELGATAVHHAAFAGHRAVVRLLVEKGADINARDGKHGATPAGWAIEYLREMGGFLAVELADFAHAIRRGDVEWVRRFLRRSPALRRAADLEGKPFTLLAEESGNREIAKLFG